MRIRKVLWLFVAGVAACGDTGSGAGRPPEITGPITRTAPAAPDAPPPGAPTTARPPARNGSIIGTVDVPDYANGPCFVAAADRIDKLVANRPDAVAPVDADGLFVLEYLAPGSYTVAAFLDQNNNGGFDYGQEPYVAWPQQLDVAAGAPATGIALSNFLDLPNPAVRTQERGEEVARLHARAEAAFQNLLRAELPPDVDAASLVPTLRIMIVECRERWQRAQDEETWAFVRDTLTALPDWIAAVQRGEDPFADARGWQLRAFVRAADRAVVPYLLYVPHGYDGSTPMPLVLGLHGGGGSHWTGGAMLAGESTLAAFGPDRAPGVWPPDPQVDMFIVTPTGDRTASLVPWRALGEANAMGAVEEVQRRYAIDRNRTYITGMSDGGRGAWEICTRWPDRFAAMLVGAGATDAAIAVCMNVAHMPVKLVHGTHDQIIPIWNAHNIIEAAKPYNARIELQEVDRGHNVADIAYADGAAFRWLAQHVRNPTPPVVRYRTNSVEYGEGAGVVITALGTPNTLADVQVHWQGPDRVQVDSRNVAGLTLRVPSDAAATIAVQWNGHAFNVAGAPDGIHMEASVTAAGAVEWVATAVDAPPTAAPRGWAARRLG